VVYIFISARLPRSSVTTALDHVLTQCVEKLADGNARLREGGRKAIDAMAASSVVGPSAVQYHLVKALPPKQKTAWRPIQARLQVLADLVNLYGLNNNSGLHMDTMLNFSKTVGAYAHSNGDVREAAKQLVVAIEKQVGREPLEPTLSLLRKNQREEYEAAFNSPDNNAAPVGGSSAKKAPSSAGGGNREHKNSSPPRRTDMSHQHATHNPGGKVPTSAARVQDQRDGYPQDEKDHQDQPGQEFTSCMFCGVHNASWTENDLDLHYWKDCPLLIACPSCSQIVEIAGLPEHLLDECDAKGSYEPCEVTGASRYIILINIQKKIIIFVNLCVIRSRN
jgi:centrosomal protein CEP104